MKKNHWWKITTIVFLAVNVSSFNNSILNLLNPGQVNKAIPLFIQASGPQKLQCGYILKDESREIDNKFSFLTKSNAGFSYIVKIVEAKYGKTNIPLPIPNPDVILNCQISDEGDALNPFTTKRLIYFAKFIKSDMSIKHQGQYKKTEFENLYSDIKPITSEQLLIGWINDDKAKILGRTQLWVLAFIFSLIIFPKWEAFLCAAMKETRQKTLGKR